MKLPHVIVIIIFYDYLCAINKYKYRAQDTRKPP